MKSSVNLSARSIEKLTKELNTLVTEEILESQNTYASTRIARVILAYKTPESVCNSKGAFDFRITQSEIADAVGVSRTYVSTIINEWKREEILRGYGRTICVLDEKRLCEIANGQP